MADTDDKKENKDAKVEQNEQTKQAGTKISILTWVVMAAVVALLAGSGFFLGRLFAGHSSPVKTEDSQSQEKTSTTEAPTPEDSKTNSEGTWYYNDLESIIVNPDEPGATRFVRVGVILEISSELSQDKAKELINSKKPLLINWVNLYFKSLTLEQMRNGRDMKRIQSQILDSFNEILFPKSKPQIKKVLIREFNIQ